MCFSSHCTSTLTPLCLIAASELLHTPNRPAEYKSSLIVLYIIYSTPCARRRHIGVVTQRYKVWIDRCLKVCFFLMASRPVARCLANSFATVALSGTQSDVFPLCFGLFTISLVCCPENGRHGNKLSAGNALHDVTKRTE